jgi:hypothetical protein
MILCYKGKAMFGFLGFVIGSFEVLPKRWTATTGFIIKISVVLK